MDRVLEQLGRAQRQRAAAAGGAAAPDLEAFWVLSIDVRGRTSAFEELPCGWVGERPDSAHLLGMLGAASAEAVHPACYVGVGRALGKEPLKVAPYIVSSNFLGHRLVVWTPDDLPPLPTGLPAVQCVLGKLTSTPKRGDKVFLALYPRVPNSSHQPGATPVPGTGFALQHGDGAYVYPVDPRGALRQALDNGQLVLKYLSVAEADAGPLGSFSLSLGTTRAPGGTLCTLVREHENWLCNHCNAPCHSKCSTCRNAAYCGEACQAAAWKAHSPECAPPGMRRRADEHGIDKASTVPDRLAEEAARWRRGDAVASEADLWAAFELINSRTPVDALRRLGHEVGPSARCVWLEFDDAAAASRFAGKAVRKAIRGPLDGDLFQPHLVAWDERRRKAVAERLAAEPLAADGRLLVCVTARAGGTIYGAVHELARTTPAQAEIILDTTALALQRVLASCPPLAGLLPAGGAAPALPVIMTRLGARCAACEAAAHLRLCARCSGAQYCSKACQEGDWRRHKQSECADLRLLVDFVKAR